MTLTDAESAEVLDETKHYSVIELMSESFTGSIAMDIHYVHVEDESDMSDTKELTQNKIDTLDQTLYRHKEYKKPKVYKHELLRPESMNPVSTFMYGGEFGPSGEFPCLREWIESAPSAKALTPMYMPNIERLVGRQEADDELFNGTEIDPNSHDFFLNGIDAIAIRSRARILETIANEDNGTSRKSWVSLACGAAIPVFNSLSRSKGEVDLKLIDIDEEALLFAQKLGVNKGYKPGHDFQTIQSDLEADLMYSDKLVHELGQEDTDMVDMMGIFEYFRPQTAALLLKKSFDLVKDEGMLVLANMLSDRPQLDFNQRGVGWPGIFPRSKEEIAEIIDSSGISYKSIDMYIPEDGVYAVVRIIK